MGFRVNSAGKVNQGHFSKIPSSVAAPRSSFDRSFAHKTTLNEGYLYPIFWEPILPGDTVNLTMNAIARLATPIFPYMDNVYMDVHFFFVPNRLVWDNWERFQGAQDDPDSSVEFEVPQLDDATHAAGFSELSLYDYFGLPTKVASVVQADMPISLPFRSYYKIFNDWYRDENLQDSLVFSKGDGPDTTAFALQKRNRRKDYFTSALPWPQKGPAVTLPLGDRAPVTGIGTYNQNYPQGPVNVYETAGTGTVSYPATGAKYFGTSADNDTFMALREDPDNPGFPAIYAELDSATSITVNALRESIVLQQMLELDARGGTRYVEILLSRFGVISPDFRLQRSEYLGGQTLDVNVSPIAQTSSTDAETPQGSLAGFALARGRAAVSHSFVEHGQLLGLVSFRADTTYQQGMSRHWSVRTRYDYYEPLAANLGEQAILNKEIFQSGSTTPDNEVFGYQERWAEYRYKPSYVTGLFRSNATASLDSWHLAIDFASLPALEDIIPESPPIDRIVAVTTEPHFILDTWTRFRHVRVLPIYSAPGLTRL
nr:MAG: major capsid protein [Microvirus sp.]